VAACGTCYGDAGNVGQFFFKFLLSLSRACKCVCVYVFVCPSWFGRARKTTTMVIECARQCERKSVFLKEKKRSFARSHYYHLIYIMYNNRNVNGRITEILLLRVVVGGFCRTKGDGNNNYYYCKGDEPDGIREGVIEIKITRSTYLYMTKRIVSRTKRRRRCWISRPWRIHNCGLFVKIW